MKEFEGRTVLAVTGEAEMNACQVGALDTRPCLQPRPGELALERHRHAAQSLLVEGRQASRHLLDTSSRVPVFRQGRQDLVSELRMNGLEHSRGHLSLAARKAVVEAGAAQACGDGDQAEAGTLEAMVAKDFDEGVEELFVRDDLRARHASSMDRSFGLLNG